MPDIHWQPIIGNCVLAFLIPLYIISFEILYYFLFVKIIIFQNLLLYTSELNGHRQPCPQKTVVCILSADTLQTRTTLIHILSIERRTLQEYRWNSFQNNRIENMIELITIMWFRGFIFNSWPSILEDLWLLWLLRLKNSANKLALFLW